MGDTLDRDVVAARRAKVGTVLLTRSQHTDDPPFPVRAEPDATYPDPRGLLEAFQAATTAAPQPVPSTTAATSGTPVTGRAALLIDHGGVISTSRPDPAAVRELAADLAALLSSPAAPMSPRTALRLITAARTQAKRLKSERRREVSPAEFWVELVGEQLTVRQRALLRAEAGELTYRLGLLKSRRTLREGVLELLTTCRENSMPVAVVSNTVSGRAVRAICTAHGLDELIGAYLCSDEFGIRKPAAAIVQAALDAVAADPGKSWFLGDKPAKDAAAARAAGIAHRVLVRGGSTPDTDLQAAVQTGLATAVVDTPGDLRDLILTEKTLLPV
ncbi:HAD family hydrolase [Ruania albidiflava]|uniref:HAD family hydrolase n=1 Tax=Ruania albidiflava TaxID=366586 RepID=UPI0003FD7B9E|nr:HAD family hydrolase [Ruania albidiflava]